MALVDAPAVAGVDVVQHATASPVGQELLGAITTPLIGTSRAVEHAGFDPDVQARILAIAFAGLHPPDADDPHRRLRTGAVVRQNARPSSGGADLGR